MNCCWVSDQDCWSLHTAGLDNKGCTAAVVADCAKWSRGSRGRALGGVGLMEISFTALDIAVPWSVSAVATKHP
jgi:hypothetical protein